MRKITLLLFTLFLSNCVFSQCQIFENFPDHLTDRIYSGGVIYDAIFVHVDDTQTVTLRVDGTRGVNDINRQIDITGWCIQYNWEHSQTQNSWQDFVQTEKETLRVVSMQAPQRFFKVRIWAWNEATRRGATTLGTIIFDTE